MCGPLALAGCAARGEVQRRRALAYFGGRFGSHVFAGAVFGWLGGLAGVGRLGGLQQALLTIVAAGALVHGVQLLVTCRGARRAVASGASIAGAAAFLARFVPRRSLSLGLVTGVLPCGLLAGAWALAAASGSPVAGAFTMAAFSFATAPALGLGVAAGFFVPRTRIRGSLFVQGVLWCGLAVWLGARVFLASGSAHCGVH
jgi:hypothetical protein